MCVKADLHGTTLSHTCRLLVVYLSFTCRLRQVYDMLHDDCRVGPKSCRRPVASLLYAKKSYRINRPLQLKNPL